MRGVRKKRRRRGEEEWLRFHYILYMSKMPGRLLPASLLLPAECVFAHARTPPSFHPLSHFLMQKKKNYLSGFRVSKLDLSRRVARGRSHEPRLHRETQKGVKRKEEERLSNTCVIHLQSFIPSPVFRSCNIHGNER